MVVRARFMALVSVPWPRRGDAMQGKGRKNRRDLFTDREANEPMLRQARGRGEEAVQQITFACLRRKRGGGVMRGMRGGAQKQIWYRTTRTPRNEKSIASQSGQGLQMLRRRVVWVLPGRRRLYSNVDGPTQTGARTFNVCQYSCSCISCSCIFSLCRTRRASERSLGTRGEAARVEAEDEGP